jgi:hypothetical protein
MTTNRNYVNGANFERRIKARLEAEGYTCFRTAGSHTPCDLIAVMRGGIETDTDFWTKPHYVFVQAKGGQKSMTRKAVAEFRDYALAHGARPLLVERGMKYRWLDEEAA